MKIPSFALASMFTTAICVAQGAASATFALSESTIADGGRAQSTQFVMQSTVGPSPTTAIAFSASFGLAGGFLGGLDVPIGGTPMLTGVNPLFVTMRGHSAITVHGTGLIAGASPTLTIGGVPASIGARTNGTVSTSVPTQPAPGWLPITFTSSGQSATLARGIGVLPLLDSEPALGIRTPGQLVYRGSQGDLMVYCIGTALAPTPLPVAGFGHGLLLSPAGLLVTNSFAVTDPSGVFRFTVPGLPVANTLFVQAVAISSNPGYAPGSFTNPLRVF